MLLDVLTEESIIELARTVMNPVKCDASDTIGSEKCDAELASVEAFQLHLMKHYGVLRNGSAQYQCLGLNSSYCQLTDFSSLDELRNHINKYHMKTVRHPCPFRSCKSTQPLRLDKLWTHFQSAHAPLHDIPLDQLGPHLRPSWRPVHRPPEHPPPLPEPSRRLLSEFIAPVTVPKMKHPRDKTPVRHPTPSLSLSQIPLTPIRQLTRSLTRLPSIESVQSTRSTLEDLQLDDLVYPKSGVAFPNPDDELIVWRRPTVLNRDVTRSLPMELEKRTKLFEPPISIHYEVFKKKVEKLIEDGILGPIDH
ncbi:hypothetical protein PQX77_004128 [Marasmius sp. AFHP31]|nr:hypothetical protein PQX77_004128 [Marasmius sp. AFHP31]